MDQLRGDEAVTRARKTVIRDVHTVEKPVRLRCPQQLSGQQNMSTAATAKLPALAGEIGRVSAGRSGGIIVRCSAPKRYFYGEMKS